MRSTLSLCLFSGVVSCSSPTDDDGEDRQFAGRVETTESFAGIVANDNLLIAYVCDGTPAAVTVSAWFVATPEDGHFEAANPSGAQLVGDLDEDSASGEYIASDGTRLAFTAAAATGDSGLYFGERGMGADERWGGWIIDGSEQRGAVVETMSGDIIATPAIDPSTNAPVDVEGAPLEFERVEEPLDESVEELPPGG